MTDLTGVAPWCEAAAEWDHAWTVIDGVEQCNECGMGAGGSQHEAGQ